MANPNPKTEHLKATQIKPGEVRNPRGGSAKGRLTDALIKLIKEKGLDDPFVQVGMKAALKGDFKFWAYIFDRVDGKMVERQEIDATTDATQTLRDFLDDSKPDPAKKPKAKKRKAKPKAPPDR